LSATQRNVTKEKSPRGKCFDKTTQSPIGVYKLASYGLFRQCKPFCPILLACFMTNHFPMRGLQKLMDEFFIVFPFINFSFFSCLA